MLGINCMRQEYQPVFILEPLRQAEHLFFYLWTNGRTGDEEKIYHISFSGKSLIVDLLTILVHKGKVTNGMIDGISIHHIKLS